MAFRHASDQSYKCPICGKENTPHETFRCRRCGRMYLCSDHLNPTERVCEECVSIKPKESAEEKGMVLIHEGEFFMGQDDDPEAMDAAPLHGIRLDQFLIDRDLVSNAQFKLFKPEHDYPEGADEEPVVNVSYFDAKAYAESLGKRLPTEPEWEKAARSRDKRNYPWGDEIPREALDAGAMNLRESLKKYNVSAYRVRDMSGGPWEWIDSEYEPYPNGNTSIPGYYQGNKVIRGGQVNIDKPAKTFHRAFAHPTDGREDISFRCCKGKPQEYDPIYAGTDIKRPKKTEASDAPPPEFKALRTKEDRASEVIKKVELSGLTVKEMIRASKEENERLIQDKNQPVSSHKHRARVLNRPQKEKPIVHKDEDWMPEPEKPPVPWVGIIIIIVALVVVGGYFLMNKGGSSSTPEQTTTERYLAPSVRPVRLSTGNVFGPTSISVLKGDRVTLSVQGWKDTMPAPPLVTTIGNSPEISIGGFKTFISEYDGEIKLMYKGATVEPPEGMTSFEIVVKLEKKIQPNESGET